MHIMEDYRDEDRKKGKKSDDDEDEVDDDATALGMGGKNPLAEEEKIEADDTGED